MGEEDRPAACSALWEPDVRRVDDTHSCCRVSGHDGSHLCPLCKAAWTLQRPHPVTPKSANGEQGDGQ